MPRILLSLCALALFIHPLHGQPLERYSVRTVVIDPGHGGKDPGCIGVSKKTQEKDIVLPIALRLGKLIGERYPEVRIAYTRKDDTFMDLRDRSRFANSQNADLFISIHCNSFPQKRSVNGFETYVMGLHHTSDNLRVAMQENAVITYEDNFESKYEGYDPNSEESFIIFSMLQNAHLDQSLQLAEQVQHEAIQRTGLADRNVRQAGFWVLVGTTMPSILVEAGYLSNAKDEELLRSEKGQEAVAQALFNAFCAYKNSVDGDPQLPQPPTKPAQPTQPAKPATQPAKPTTPAQPTQPAKPATQPAKNTTPAPSAQPAKPTTQPSGIEFRIQLLTAAKPVDIANNAQLKAVGSVDELHIDGRYRYTTGRTPHYDELLPRLAEVRKTFSDAFIIALRNGKPIPVQEAKAEAAQNPNNK